MSNTEALPIQINTLIKKKEIFADLIAFCSIVRFLYLGSYFFILLALYFDVFQSQLELVLNSYTTIIILHLSYIALILVLKLLVTVLTLIKQAEGEKSLAGWIKNEVDFSILVLLFVPSQYTLVHIAWRPFSILQLCKMTLWLWFSELMLILGGLLGRLTSITSFSYLGRSIQVILLIGVILQPFG